MSARKKKDQEWLLETARTVALELKPRTLGTPLSIRQPSRVAETNTGGWYATLGNLGKDQPHLEIWLDHFTGHPSRRFWACFSSSDHDQINAITQRLDKRLIPHRVITEGDTGNDEVVRLAQRLKREEFNQPILEQYEDGLTFLGLYDQTRPTTEWVSPYFVQRAAAFFEAVARCLEGGRPENDVDEAYPRVENRTAVASHLRRERSRLLATDRKIMDDFQCQVCGLRFAEAYGKLGVGYAEAHHLLPLSRLEGATRTRLEDLTTVCANCHRMLHKMKGERGDVAKLSAILVKNLGTIS